MRRSQIVGIGCITGASLATRHYTTRDTAMALDQETLSQFIATLERFVAERLRPLESQVGTEDRIPDDVIAEMKELGLFGLTIPEQYGGLGLNMAEEVAVAEVVEVNLVVV